MRTFKRKDDDEKERDVFLGKLAERFIIPPFSVLDRRSQRWRERRKTWAFLPCDTDGRNDGLTWGTSEFMAQFSENGTSAFDPFLAELMYAWFCPSGGKVYDPFSGGITRGAVAASMGLNYFGLDVRADQVESNARLWGGVSVPPSVLRNYANRVGVPTWICADSVTTRPCDDSIDFVFTSPPYNDTEKYSSNPQDLSTLDESGFSDAFARVVDNCYRVLKNNRFAAFNVGNTRDAKTGEYRDLHGLVVTAGKKAGFTFWNDFVVVDPVASKFVYAEKGFVRTRKCPHTHQYVVVLLKGDPVLAADRALLEF